MVFLLAFLVVPLVEIAVFIRIGDLIGVWPTVGLVVLTAVIGSALVYTQGFSALYRARAALEQGDVPVRELIDGLCLLVAGLLLLTPGFVTDIAGYLLLLPPMRLMLGRRLFATLRTRANLHVYINGSSVELEPTPPDEPPDRRPEPVGGDDASDGPDDPMAPQAGPRLEESLWGARSKAKLRRPRSTS